MFFRGFATSVLLPALLLTSPACQLSESKADDGGAPDKPASSSAPAAEPAAKITAPAKPSIVGARKPVDLPATIAALSDTDPQVRMRAVKDLGRAGPGSKEAVAALVTLLKDKDAGMQQAAANGLGQFGPAAKEATPALVEAFAGDRAVRTAAIAAVAKIGVEAKAAVPGLTALLENDDEQVRLEAAIALRSIGQGKSTAPALKRLLESIDEKVRLQAAVALHAISEEGEPCRVVLVKLLVGKDPQVRRGTAAELATYRSEAKDSIPALVRLLKDQNAFGYIREEAASALVAIRPDSQVVKDALAAAIKDKRKGVQNAAAAALRKTQ